MPHKEVRLRSNSDVTVSPPTDVAKLLTRHSMPNMGETKGTDGALAGGSLTPQAERDNLLRELASGVTSKIGKGDGEQGHPDVETDLQREPPQRRESAISFDDKRYEKKIEEEEGVTTYEEEEDEERDFEKFVEKQKTSFEESHKRIIELYGEAESLLDKDELIERTGIDREDIAKIKEKVDKAITDASKALEQGNFQFKDQRKFVAIIGEADDMQEELEDLVKELKGSESQEPHSDTKS